MDTIGKRLAALRKKSELNQKQVCEDIGIAQSFLSTIERDMNGFSAETLMRFCDLYNTTPEYIMFGRVSDEAMREDDQIMSLVSMFKRLSPESKSLVMGMVKSAADLSKPSGAEGKSDKRKAA